MKGIAHQTRLWGKVISFIKALRIVCAVTKIKLRKPESFDIISDGQIVGSVSLSLYGPVQYVKDLKCYVLKGMHLVDGVWQDDGRKVKGSMPVIKSIEIEEKYRGMGIGPEVQREALTKPSLVC